MMGQSSRPNEDGEVMPRCFLDVSIDGEKAGRIVVELFSNVCPKTCENFRALCTGEKSSTQRLLHYRGSPFHRVVKNFMIQAGDFINGNGTGGESIYGPTFADENLELKHDKDFILSMANKGPNTNASQFFITTQASSHLDGMHTVFGRVVAGKQVVRAIEAEKVDENYRPLRNITIIHCGELVLQKRDDKVSKATETKKKKKHSHSSKSKSTGDSAKSEASADSAGEKAAKKKRKKDKKNRKHKKKSKKAKESDFEENVNAEKDDFEPSVRPDEIPPVPAHNFLGRGTGRSAIDEMRQVDDEYVDYDNPFQRRGNQSSIWRRDDPVEDQRNASGRVLKGRGSFRFQGESLEQRRYRRNDDDDDDTPAHWRTELKKTMSYDEYLRRKKDKEQRDKERELQIEEQRREQMIIMAEREKRRRERERDRSRSRSVEATARRKAIESQDKRKKKQEEEEIARREMEDKERQMRLRALAAKRSVDESELKMLASNRRSFNGDARNQSESSSRSRSRNSMAEQRSPSNSSTGSRSPSKSRSSSGESKRSDRPSRFARERRSPQIASIATKAVYSGPQRRGASPSTSNSSSSSSSSGRQSRGRRRRSSSSGHRRPLPQAASSRPRR